MADKIATTIVVIGAIALSLIGTAATVFIAASVVKFVWGNC